MAQVSDPTTYGPVWDDDLFKDEIAQQGGKKRSTKAIKLKQFSLRRGRTPIGLDDLGLEMGMNISAEEGGEEVMFRGIVELGSKNVDWMKEGMEDRLFDGVLGREAMWRNGEMREVVVQGYYQCAYYDDNILKRGTDAFIIRTTGNKLYEVLSMEPDTYVQSRITFERTQIINQIVRSGEMYSDDTIQTVTFLVQKYKETHGIFPDETAQPFLYAADLFSRHADSLASYWARMHWGTAQYDARVKVPRSDWAKFKDAAEATRARCERRGTMWARKLYIPPRARKVIPSKRVEIISQYDGFLLEYGQKPAGTSVNTVPVRRDIISPSTLSRTYLARKRSGPLAHNSAAADRPAYRKKVLPASEDSDTDSARDCITITPTKSQVQPPRPTPKKSKAITTTRAQPAKPRNRPRKPSDEPRASVYRLRVSEEDARDAAEIEDDIIPATPSLGASSDSELEQRPDSKVVFGPKEPLPFDPSTYIPPGLLDVPRMSWNKKWKCPMPGCSTVLNFSRASPALHPLLSDMELERVRHLGNARDIPSELEGLLFVAVEKHTMVHIEELGLQFNKDKVKFEWIPGREPTHD